MKHHLNEAKYRLGCDDLNWSIQKRERTGAGKSRWRHIKWYGDNLPLALSNLFGLLAREQVDPDLGLLSTIEALEGAKWSLCQLKADELAAEGRYLRPDRAMVPRGAAPSRGHSLKGTRSQHA